MSALVEAEDSQTSEVERLSKHLSELEEKLDQTNRIRTLKTVAVESGGEDGQLGPSVTTEIYVNRVPTEALIDTGSPATIVFLDFVLDIFVKEKTDRQTPAQWKEATSKRFSPPTVLLKAYSGHKLNILSQVALTLSHGNRTTDARVLVQEGAPTKFLLGTDLQSKLGFALIAEMGDTRTDLLTGKAGTPEMDTHTSTGTIDPSTAKTDAPLSIQPDKFQTAVSATTSQGVMPRTLKGSLLGAQSQDTHPHPHLTTRGRQSQDGQDQRELQPVVRSADKPGGEEASASQFMVDKTGDKTQEGRKEHTTQDDIREGSMLAEQIPLTRTTGSTLPATATVAGMEGADATGDVGAAMKTTVGTDSAGGAHQNTNAESVVLHIEPTGHGEGTGPEREGVTPLKAPTEQDDPAAGVGIVRLLKTTKVPAGYQKMVRTKIEGEINDALLLFEPLPENDYSLPDAVLDKTYAGDHILVVQNSSNEPVSKLTLSLAR